MAITGKIVTLQDKNQNIFPETAARAVYMSDGKTLEEVIQNGGISEGGTGGGCSITFEETTESVLMNNPDMIEKVNNIDKGLSEVNSQLERIAINVKDFGAKGDGITDDTEPIQNALLYLRNNGGNLIIDKGEYKITKQLKIYSNTNILMKKDTVMLNYILNGSTSVFSNFNINDEITGYNGEKNITIKGGKILCIPSNEMIEIFRGLEDWGNQALSFSHGSDIIIDNVYFQDIYRAHAIEITGCKNVIVKNCTFDGWLSDERYDTNKIREAIQIEASIKGANQGGLWDNTPCKNIQIFNNRVEKINSIYENFCTGFGSHSNIDNSDNIQIYNNNIKNCQYSGVTYGKWINSKIEDNKIEGCCYGITSFITTSLKNCIIQENKIINTSNRGIMLHSNCFNIDINNNIIDECGDVGLYVNENSDNIVINDNTLINCNNLLKDDTYIRIYGLTNSKVYNNNLFKTNEKEVNIGIRFGENSEYPFKNTTQYDNFINFECKSFDVALTPSLINNENIISTKETTLENNAVIISKINPLKFKNLILDLSFSGIKRILCPVSSTGYDVFVTNVGSSNGIATIKFSITMSNGQIKLTNPRLTTINDSSQATTDITTSNGYKITKVIGVY